GPMKRWGLTIILTAAVFHLACFRRNDPNVVRGARRSALTDAPLPGIGLVAVGGQHACVVVTGGKVECWGLNSSGQLGNGPTIDSSRPSHGPGLTGVSTVGVGIDFSCALTGTGVVQCWGSNGHGQLGLGVGILSSSTPVVTAGPAAAKLAVGGQHAVPVLQDRTEMVVGQNDPHQHGVVTAADPFNPTPVALTNLLQLAAGSNFTCAVLSNHTADCWGDNSFGQLGDLVSQNMFPSPTALSNLTNVVGITAGQQHACAKLSGGKALFWGHNTFSHLGNGGASPPSATPVNVLDSDLVSTLPGIALIAAGAQHTCAVMTGGSVRCWGDGTAAGQLGNGTMLGANVPVPVPGLAGVSTIAA